MEIPNDKPKWAAKWLLGHTRSSTPWAFFTISPLIDFLQENTKSTTRLPLYLVWAKWLDLKRIELQRLKQRFSPGLLLYELGWDQPRLGQELRLGKPDKKLNKVLVDLFEHQLPTLQSEGPDHALSDEVF